LFYSRQIEEFFFVLFTAPKIGFRASTLMQTCPHAIDSPNHRSVSSTLENKEMESSAECAGEFPGTPAVTAAVRIQLFQTFSYILFRTLHRIQPAGVFVCERFGKGSVKRNGQVLAHKA
jgi:hypothetical protein